MDRKGKQAIIGTLLVAIVIVIAVTVTLVKKFTPSKEKMDLEQYYEVQDDELLVILENQIYEKKGIIVDNQAYLDYESVVSLFNERFYWDSNENLLIYTTPTEIIKTEVGSNDYYVNKGKSTKEYQIVKTKGDMVYVAMDFVKEFSNIDFQLYDKPNRIIIQKDWDTAFLVSSVKKATQLRVEDSIKSPILKELSVGDELVYVDTDEVAKKSFVKVMTKEGIIGYVKEKFITKSEYKENENKTGYKAPVYTSIQKDYKINLVWHQVTNQTANDNLLNLLSATKGVTTISPTWFSVISEKGDISSLASERYVDRAHNAGVEVWGLVDDFNPDVDMYQLLTYTSRREKLINELLATAIKYNLDGINIDFERIKLDAGKHYIQFIRELSVKCRNNGIVLSIDNYAPAPYSQYYNRKEQGIVADYVITMAYDEHHASSEVSGSVASIQYVKDATINTLKEVPANKTIIALPFYTRIWKEETIGDTVNVSSDAYSMTQAQNFLDNNGAKAEWNEETKQYYAEFKKDNIVYKTWLEEDESIDAKMKVVSDNNVAGVAGWRLGLEKSSIWNVILKYIN